MPKYSCSFVYDCSTTKIIFQESKRPSKNVLKSRKNISGKHKIYGLLIELSVLSVGLYAGYTKHGPVSVSDHETFPQNGGFNRESSEKLFKIQKLQTKACFRECKETIYNFALKITRQNFKYIGDFIIDKKIKVCSWQGDAFMIVPSTVILIFTNLTYTTK